MQQGRDSRQHLKGFLRSARKARAEMEPFWKKYQEEIKGRQRRKGKGPRRLTNYPYLFERTLMPQLAARCPDVWVEPVMAWSDAVVAEIEGLALQEIVKRQRFIDELRLCIQDGMYAFMYRKVGMYAADQQGAGGGDPGGFYGDPMWLDGSMPFFERISPHDAIWDDSADDFRRTVGCGHEFTRDIDSVMADDRYDAACREKAADARSRMREKTKQRFQSFDEADIPAFCNLVELFIRPTRQLYTLIEVCENEWEILRKVPFYGGANGPFDMRAFTTNDEVTGMAPACAWWDAYTEYELAMQKNYENALAEKRIATCDSESADAAKKFKAARPNDLIVGAVNIKSEHYGGVTEEGMVWSQSRKGELELLSAVSSTRVGVAQKGKSATAEYIAESNADAGVQELRSRVIGFAECGLDDMRWYIHNEPSFAIRATVTSPEGLPAEVGIAGGPEMDPFTGEPLPQSPAEDFRTRIDAKSLYADDDALTKQKAVGDATFVLTTLRPFLNSQGMDLNAVGYCRQLEQKAGIEGLTRNLVPLSPVAMALMQQSAQQTPTGESVGAAARPGGGDLTQSQVQNSPETGQANSDMAKFVSPRRMASTAPGANNAETSGGYGGGGGYGA